MARSRLLQPLSWYQWNPTQWQGSRKVQRMDWAARGLYRELMDECWIKGSVPATVDGIAGLFEVEASEIAPLLPQVIRCFDVHEDGTMTSLFIEEIRTEADARRVIQAERRLGKTKNGEPRLTTVNQAEPQTTAPNQSEVEEKRREEKRKEVPPSPQGGTAKAARAPRRSRVEILEPFGPEVCRVVNTLTAEWRDKDPEDGRLITIGIEAMGEVVDSILKSQPNVTADVLIQAGRDYLSSTRMRYKAPQYFFGAQGPWVGHVKAILTAQPVELAHAV